MSRHNRYVGIACGCVLLQTSLTAIAKLAFSQDKASQCLYQRHLLLIKTSVIMASITKISYEIKSTAPSRRF